MKYLHKFRAMPLFRKSKRRCRLDHYLIAAPSNPGYRIVFLTKFRSSLVSRSNKQTRGSAAKIGRAHVRTPDTNAHLVLRLLIEKKKQIYPREITANIIRIHY